MTVAVVGAGPIGLLIAAALTHAGRDAVLIDVLPNRLAPIASYGVRLIGPRGHALAHPPTALAHEVAFRADVAFLDVPYRATPAACAVLERILAPHGTAVALQHGLHAQRVSELLGRERTVVACAGFDVAHSAPTDVTFTAGRFVVGAVGATPAALPAVVIDLLAHAGFEAVLAPDVRPHLWSTATITALLAAQHAPDPVGDPVTIAREFVALAAAYGVEVEAKEGLDLTAFAPGQPLERSTAAWCAWRPPERDPARASWCRRVDGIAPTAALAESIGHPLSAAGALLAATCTGFAGARPEAGVAAD